MSEARVSLARALSKLGHCSRSEGDALVRASRVRVNGDIITDPSRRVDPARDRITVDNKAVRAATKMYLMLNKPRGLVTTANDERGRDTVYTCLPLKLPHISAVGRLDRDSEGLLLFTNDTQWGNRITAPESHIDKTYHVQINGIVSGSLLKAIENGVQTRRGDVLSVARTRILRTAGATTWLEVILDEGKNRQIRRIFEALDLEVLRLVRVAIGSLELGKLETGRTRPLTQEEIDSLRVGLRTDSTRG
ncbi:MAG: pseudouridine synthase [Gemmatimonadota bacterium]